MDFTPGEAEAEVSRLAAQVLSAGAGAAASTDLDAALWKELAGTGLLSLALPVELGGDGLGVQAVAALLTELGKHAARIPALATLALGVLPVARTSGDAVREELLAGVSSGDTILTAAFREPSQPTPTAPSTRFDSASGTVTGVKLGVPYAAAARWILVPAGRDDDRTASGAANTASGAASTAVVVAVAADSPGLSCERTHSSSGLPEYTVRLERTPVRHVLNPPAVVDLYRCLVTGACAVADGAVAAALDLTTQHIRAREQFGRPLATFQAVAQQIADVYATARTLHLATVSACWRLDSGPDTGRDADVAAYWLARYAPAALRTCHHLHGGIGMDASYPLHRYSALVTDLVSMVGGAGYRLDLLAAREA
jgi:3-oxo-4-pregnene-20-carboxyl-CoA dehydrogenase alpha subunit